VAEPSTDPVRWYDNNIFFEDSDSNDNGQEIESEGNDDNVDGGTGDYIACGQI
jgi:hypothetical protein